MIHVLKKITLILVALFLFSSCSESKPSLYIYTWAEYLRPEIIEEFEKRYNCEVVVDTFDSNESMFAKLSLGVFGYDVIFPSNYILEIMKEKEMIQDLDLSLIPNSKFIDKNFLKLLHADFSNFSVPYLITYTGIGYRKDKIAHVAPTWNEFNRIDLRGRMTMLNDIREVMGAALKFLGYSINTVNKDELSQAIKLVIEWKKNLAKFESEQYKNGIASSEYLLVQGYNGDVCQVIQDNENVDFFYPNEGSLICCDFLVIPKNAPNVPLAHEFINFLLQPEIAAKNIEYTFYSSPNSGARSLLPEKLQKSHILFPPSSILEKSEVIRYLGPSQELYNQAWDEIKAAR